jgi:hypothetical protein
LAEASSSNAWRDRANAQRGLRVASATLRFSFRLRKERALAADKKLIGLALKEGLLIEVKK